MLRIDSGRLTADIAWPTRPPIPGSAPCSSTSGVRWGSFEELPALLADAGYTQTLDAGDDRRAYLKDDCDPPG